LIHGHLVGLFAALVLVVLLHRARVEHAYAQHQLLRVVVVEDAVEVVAEVLRYLFGYGLHGQLLVGHALAVELDAEQPRRQFANVKVGHFVVDVDPLLVLGYGCYLRVGIVVDGRV
jgi:hypothetical protein